MKGWLGGAIGCADLGCRWRGGAFDVICMLQTSCRLRGTDCSAGDVHTTFDSRRSATASLPCLYERHFQLATPEDLAGVPWSPGGNAFKNLAAFMPLWWGISPRLIKTRTDQSSRSGMGVLCPGRHGHGWLPVSMVRRQSVTRICTIRHAGSVERLSTLGSRLSPQMGATQRLSLGSAIERHLIAESQRFRCI